MKGVGDVNGKSRDFVGFCGMRGFFEFESALRILALCVV